MLVDFSLHIFPVYCNFFQFLFDTVFLSTVTPDRASLAKTESLQIQGACLLHTELEMWANAQPDGRPVEYR